MKINRVGVRRISLSPSPSLTPGVVNTLKLELIDSRMQLHQCPHMAVNYIWSISVIKRWARGLIIAWPAGACLTHPLSGGLVFSTRGTCGKAQTSQVYSHGGWVEDLFFFFSHASEPHEYIPALSNYFALMWNFQRALRPFFIYLYSRRLSDTLQQQPWWQPG